MNRIAKIITCILPLFAIILLVFQIILTNEMVGVGSTVASLEGQIDTLSKEESYYTKEVASASSLFSIREKAVAMGFKETKTYVTMGTTQPQVAYNVLR